VRTKNKLLLVEPRKTNFGKRWMNENKYPYSLGHKGMKRDHKDEKCCHAIQNFVEGRNLGKGRWGDEEWRMWKL
jgi:hypothetical protein